MVLIAWANECPARRDAATATSVSGSWLSNFFVRLPALRGRTQVRHHHADANRIRLRDDRSPNRAREDAEHGASSELDVEELGGAHRHVGLLQQEAGVLPVLEPSEQPSVATSSRWKSGLRLSPSSRSGRFSEICA